MSEIIQRVSDQLVDEALIRWPQEEIIRWLNDGAGEIVLRRPPAGTVTETMVLVDGARQELPETSLQLLDVIRNISAQIKYPIQRTSRHELESYEADWYADDYVDFVQNYSVDDRQPQVFYVWPAVREGTEVEIVHVKLPDQVSEPDDQLNLGREYIGPLISYILYRCYSKDAENNDLNLATAHYTAFNEALGANTTMQLTVSPKASEA